MCNWYTQIVNVLFIWHQSIAVERNRSIAKPFTTYWVPFFCFFFHLFDWRYFRDNNTNKWTTMTVFIWAAAIYLYINIHIHFHCYQSISTQYCIHIVLYVFFPFDFRNIAASHSETTITTNKLFLQSSEHLQIITLYKWTNTKYRYFSSFTCLFIKQFTIHT